MSIPSIAGNTTQETISYYLKSKRPQVCVLNVGMLDANIDFGSNQSIPSTTIIPDELFRDNMARFISLLQRSCQNVIWVTLHAVVETSTLKTSNCQLQRWNRIILDFLSKRNFSNVYVVDVWKASVQSDFVTNLKLGKKFHSQLARLFVAAMLS